LRVQVRERLPENANGIGGPIEGGMPDVRELQICQPLGHQTGLFHATLGEFTVVDALFGIPLLPVAN
jgi:hypothetical protein